MNQHESNQELQNENAILKEQLKALEKQNKEKDMLLAQKSDAIGCYTTEIIKLKEEMETLKYQLTLSKLKKKVSSRDSNTRKRRKKSQKKKKKKTNSKRASLPIPNEMPYFMPEITTSISNLSLQASKLPFPTNAKDETSVTKPFPNPSILPQDSNPPYMHKPSVINMLSPIAENNSDGLDGDPYTAITPITPFTPLTESNNNNNFHIDEWGASVVTITPLNSPPMSCETRITKSSARSDDEESAVSINTYTSLTSYDSYLSTCDTDTTANNIRSDSEAGSYMDSYDYLPISDNELPDKGAIICNTKSEEDLSTCDTVIASPIINLLHGPLFPTHLNLNSETVAIIKVETEDGCFSDDQYDLRMIFRGKSISELSEVEPEDNMVYVHNEYRQSILSANSGHSAWAEIDI